MMSASTIRVQRESKAAENDVYEDIMNIQDDDESKVKARIQNRDQVVAQVLADNSDLLKELMEEQGQKIMLLSSILFKTFIFIIILHFYP